MESHPAEMALFTFLETLGITIKTVRHAPVFTVEQAQAARLGADGGMPGWHTKNLFVRDKKKRRALVVAEESVKIDLRGLADLIGLGRLSFGSADSLKDMLGVEPGSVTPFGLFNARISDGEPPRLVVALDETLVSGGVINCHPLHNAATTAIAPDDLIKFIRACGYEPLIVNLTGNAG